MNSQSCNPAALESLLYEDCDAQTLVKLEKHLDHCAECQTKLTNLAAEQSLWTQASSQLSTIEQVEIPSSVTDSLQSSGTFVVPQITSASTPIKNRTDSKQLFAQDNWTQILDAPTHPEMLGKIDDLEVESKIGQGGMGIVLKGYDRELNRAVAIKVLAPHFAANGTARQRFAREAEAAAAVMHPNVVPIYSVKKSSERPYIVMQLVSGHSLQSLVQENGPLAPTDVVRISMQIAAGLSAAHKLGLIHRDVKPSNMLVERDVSRVMITDFGLARAADDVGMTQTGWLAGTPNYMSPEQARGEDIDTRNDLFSLGSLMYFIATGREPFRAETPYGVIQEIVNEQPRSPIELNPVIPPTLAEIIEKLLEKDQKNRFQSASEVFEVLEQYLAHLQHPTRTKPPKRLMTSRRKKKRAWILRTAIYAGILAFTAAGVAWIKLGQPKPKMQNPVESLVTTNSDAEAANPTNIGDENISKGSADFPVASEAKSGLEFGLGSSNDELMQQINELEKDFNQFEHNFNQVNPTSQSFDRNQPDSLQTQINEIEWELNRLKSNFRQSDLAQPSPPMQSPPQINEQPQSTIGRQDEN